VALTPAAQVGGRLGFVGDIEYWKTDANKPFHNGLKVIATSDL
jgi:hypothetical protein